MNPAKHLVSGCLIIATMALALVWAPAPVSADNWGISLDVPFVRVRPHQGYYYRDNDYGNRYSPRSHYYKPENRHYYYPSQSRHQHGDRNYDSWIGVDGSSYGDRHRHH